MDCRQIFEEGVTDFPSRLDGVGLDGGVGEQKERVQIDAKVFCLLFFLIEVQLIYDIVLVSGGQQSDSVIYMCVHVYILFQTFLLYFIIRF